MLKDTNPSPTPWSVRPIRNSDSKIIASIIDAKGNTVMSIWGDDIKIVDSLMAIASAANNSSFGQHNRRVLISQNADTAKMSRATEPS